MSDAIIIFLSIIVSFLLGSAPWLFIFRGFAWPYFLSKKTSLIRVFLKGGGFVFRPAKMEHGIITFKLHGAKHVITKIPEAFQRGLRTTWLDVQEGDTAPYIHSKVVEDTQQVEYVDEEPVLDDKGEPLMVPVIGEDGIPLLDPETKKPLFQAQTQKVSRVETVPYRRFFEGYDDSMAIENALMLVALKPKISIGNKLGIDPKILIVLLVGLAVVVFMMMSGGLIGGESAGSAVPTIP